MTFGYTQWGGRPVMLMDSSSSPLEGLALEMAGSWPHFFSVYVFVMFTSTASRSTKTEITWPMY